MILQSTQVRARVRPGHGSQQGFTLLELMVVVVVIAILSVMAYNAYNKSVMKSRRNAAASCTQQAAQYMERYYATNLRYDQDLGGTANPGIPTLGCMTDLTSFYTVSLVAGTTQSAYSITAVPKGTQLTQDTQCGTLGVTQAGTKSVTGTGTVATCW